MGAARLGALCTTDHRLLIARVEALAHGQDTAVVRIGPVATAVTEGEPAAFRLRRTGGTVSALRVGLSVTGAGKFLAATSPKAATFSTGVAGASLDTLTEDDVLAETGALPTVEPSEDTASPRTMCSASLAGRPCMCATKTAQAPRPARL